MSWNKMQNPVLTKRKTITPEILLIDGITRSGKFLLGKIVSHFERVEYFQHSPILEQIPILWKTRVFERRSAVVYLQLVVDMFVYDRIVGRNLNLRNSDHSSLRRSLESSVYLSRAKNPDVKKMIDQFYFQRRVPLFVVHETLPLVEPYFDAFSKLKIIHTRRHPVDLVHSWHRRNWGIRFFNPDRISFVPVFRSGQRSGPWFALDWEDTNQMSSIDRVIRSILTVADLEKSARRRLDQAKQKRIFFTCFEEITGRPEETIRALSKFLKVKPHRRMKSVLRREGCYRCPSVNEGKRKLYQIRKEASEEYLCRLEIAARGYEKEWGLESYFD